ncbi:hypothetical protein D9Q98_007816 [Chlorella vulgaris]|uniref:DUF4336 domain-containing protein n=1 Tax=Chlorella vulgaris TaxID=3077 RepID=A0A9D4THL9_CHLVU|nr:hypothetical protein D9Q98_007816 [Chlorella vulgaris]
MAASLSCTACRPAAQPWRTTKPQGRAQSSQAIKRGDVCIVRAALQEEKIITADAVTADLRKYRSLLPPFFSRATTLEEYDKDGLWSMTQPFNLLGLDIKLRMVIARLPDGSLLLVNPIAPTPELLEQLAGLGGEVKHILLPSASPEHWMYSTALSNQFPEATLWAAPGLLEGRGLPIPFFQRMVSSIRPRSKVMGVDPLPPELEGQVETELLAVPFFIEMAVVLPQYRALLLADTGFCMSAEDYAGASKANVDAASKMGVWDRLGPVTRNVFEANPKVGKEWVDAVLARSNWDVVIPAHATAPIADGPRAFKDCFDFLF